MQRSPGLVVTLAYDGLCTFEFAIAVEIFALPRPEFECPWYQHAVAAVDQGPLRAAGGLLFQVDGDLRLLEQADTVVIPGWRDRTAPIPPALISALRAAHARGARIVSICSGVFVLAASGLLDGLRATTHWRYCAELQARYPLIAVDPHVLYVDNGQLLCSAGSAAGIDVCLHLVARDCGQAVANRVGQRLVMAPQRSGGQAQFIEQPVRRSSRRDIAALLQWLQTRLAQAPSLAEMAAFLSVSQRTLLRRFQQATGMSPKSWLLQEQLRQARQMLEHTADTQHVAQACGFASSESLRSAFRQHVGLSPRQYRQQFGQNSASGGQSVIL
ncbi:transcriptional regulator FtrA [Atopomonas sediminilitoris]|uniref:transcriptional regulator FtrA n=1 Tax=Atopomonas sediminilitoris TaxID=2919919 RepID=UPI001F4D6D03|nr:transcriptional regulator FtrA [Atopomonas sediminilitoris]MCJ8167890.1 transcriptional regulator FtrA [Atopomonas sediminilitoris]